MTRTNPKSKGMHRSTKFLMAACASAATLGGWAWLTLTAPPPQVDAEEQEPTEIVLATPTSSPTDEVRVAMVTTPFPTLESLPKLDQLPVRGLRYVGDFVPTVVAPPPTAVPPGVPQAPGPGEPPQATPPPAVNQKKEKADAPAPQPEPPQPAPTKEPKAKKKTKSSK